jgi:hypothetical protein
MEDEWKDKTIDILANYDSKKYAKNSPVPTED